MKLIINVLDVVLGTIGKVVSLSVLVIAAVILMEIVSRLVFRVSLPWAADVAKWLMCALIMLGGPWTLSQGKFVRVDALYVNFSPKLKIWIDTVVTTVMMLILCYVLIRYGYTFAERAFLSGERPASANWNAPVWVFKALVPAGASLMVIGWAQYLLKEWAAHLDPHASLPTESEKTQIHG